MRTQIGSSVVLALALAGCSGSTADSAPTTAPTASEPAEAVDESVFSEDEEDLKAMASLAEGLEATARSAIEGVETAQQAAQELVKLSEELKINGRALNKAVDKSLSSGEVSLKGIKKKDHEAVGPALEKFVAGAAALKASAQTFADARAEFNRVESEAQRLAAAVNERTESIVSGTNEQAKKRAQADRDKATEIQGIIKNNLEAARGLVDDAEAPAKQLAEAFSIEIAEVKTAEDDVAAAEAATAEAATAEAATAEGDAASEKE